MNFDSRITLPSSLPEFAGVKFTFNKMTEGRRIKLRLAMADYHAKLREITDQASKIMEDTPEDALKAFVLHQKVSEIVSDQINPMWVRWGLKSIDGLTIDGEPATVESLIESGPPELYAEIADAIKSASGLNEQQRGESGPLTTSGAQADGRMSDTSAAPVVN